MRADHARDRIWVKGPGCRWSEGARAGRESGLAMAEFNWVVYELVCLGRVLARDYDTMEFVGRLALCPVIEGCSPEAEQVLAAHRAGYPVSVRILYQGLSESVARDLCLGQWVGGVVGQLVSELSHVV
jgi:hypothetical protein